MSNTEILAAKQNKDMELQLVTHIHALGLSAKELKQLRETRLQKLLSKAKFDLV